MAFKNLMLFIHRWLGLVSGLVVVVVALTGCLFTFQQEISGLVYRKTFFVPVRNAPTLPLSELQQKAQVALGDAQPVGFITTYRQPDRAWEFMAYKTNDTAITYFGTVTYFRSAFIDPYTGRITGIRDYKYDFFNVVKYLHWSLLLNTKYGQPIVGYSTLLFVVLLITGLVLWYPKKWNKATRRQAFAIKWKARFKRLNYDLHNVMGFYILLVALILALTGMVFSFQWFSAWVYKMATINTPVQQKIKTITSSPTTCNTGVNPLDIAFLSAVEQLPGAKRIGVYQAEDKEGTIHFYGYAGSETYYDNDELQYDRYSGKLLGRSNYITKNRGEKLSLMNYDIHVGAIGGIAGKIIAFIASLVAASLPVTGFLVWWGKRKKKGSIPQDAQSGR